MDAVTLKRWIRRFSFRNLSIRRRLPLLISLLLLIVILLFGYVSYIQVKNAALSVGKERLNSVGGQVSSMFKQFGSAMLAASYENAGRPSLKRYLQSNGKDSMPPVQQLLDKSKIDSLIPLVELFNVSGARVLSSANYDFSINIPLDSILPGRPANPAFGQVGKLYPSAGSIYFPITVSITDKKQLLGYLVKWRKLVTTREAIEQFAQLIGGKGSIYFGNDDGSLWTDGLAVVPPPPVDKKNIQDVISYRNETGENVIASAQAIADTRWLVLISLSRQSVSQTSSLFFYRLIIIGVPLLCLGILVALMMSRNITQPLHKLTAATSLIASGNYSASVEMNRRDEFGKLARSFNAMAIQVGQAQHTLEEKVKERTAQLEKANKELEAFSYSVSHDLRSPLRSINGYATILKEDFAPNLDKEGNRIIDKIISNAKMMGQLIDDLISFSKIERNEMKQQAIDMKKLAESCLHELLQHEPEHKYHLQVDPLPGCYGDENLMKQVWMNLISNALKYSSKKEEPRIEIGFTENMGSNSYFIRDNGIGFDMQYSHKLFGVFQRLHKKSEFDGTGIGLALVKRIINYHDGKIWAEATPGEGATFFFSIPENKLYG